MHFLLLQTPPALESRAGEEEPAAAATAKTEDKEDRNAEAAPVVKTEAGIKRGAAQEDIKPDVKRMKLER